MGLICDVSEWLLKDAFQYPQAVTPIFRPNGQSNHVLVDRELSPRLSTVLSIAKSSVPTEYPILLQHNAESAINGTSQSVVLWLR